MIENAALKRLNKPYSDRELVELAPTREKKNDKGETLWTYKEVSATAEAWTNYVLVILQPPPARLGNWAEISNDSETRLASWTERVYSARTVPAIPTWTAGNIAIPDPYKQETHRSFVRFTAYEGSETLTNGRYIATILRKAGKHAAKIEWYRTDRDDGVNAIIAYLDGEILAAVPPLMPGPEFNALEHDWTLTNPDMPADPRTPLWVPEWTDAEYTQPALI